MRPKSLILLLLALGCGLVASIGISQVMDARNRNAAPAVEKEPILVAAKDIKVNESLGEKNLKLEEWPKDKIPSDAIRELKDVQGQRAGGIILADEPLRKAKFAVDHRIDDIPRGYRVVTVSADAVSATGNLLQPGDRVDVVVAVKHNTGTQNQLAKTILQDIRVFAINEQYRPTEGDKSDGSISAKTVSLLVTPTQAETISLASEMGKIRLVLRHPDDDAVAETAGAEEAEILQGSTHADRNHETPSAAPDTAGSGVLAWLKEQTGGTQPVAKSQAAPPPEPEEHFVMEVIKNDELSRVDFSRKSKDGRWWNNTTGSAAPPSSAGAPTPVVDPSLPAPLPTSQPTSSSVPTTGPAVPMAPFNSSPTFTLPTVPFGNS
jgi:pilus assembly protein CpaB